MAVKAVDDETFIRLVKDFGCAETARITGTSQRAVHGRRRRLERIYQTRINVPEGTLNSLRLPEHPHRLLFDIEDGIVLIGSDSHYWPGDNSPAHRGFVLFCAAHHPTLVIKNGDLLDFPRISRFSPTLSPGQIGQTHLPEVEAELEATKERLAEIRRASPKAKHIWPLGNHDARFETRLATVAPEFGGVKGMSLKDHFPEWEPCWSVWINNDVVIKHRFRGGIWAPRNNTLLSGKTIVTGHLHSLKVHPHTDYNGTRWGVDAGTLADPMSTQFIDYTEDNPKDWRSGFVMLTFKEGKLLWPEIISVHDEFHVDFRGDLIEV